MNGAVHGEWLGENSLQIQSDMGARVYVSMFVAGECMVRVNIREEETATLAEQSMLAIKHWLDINQVIRQ